MPFPLSPEQICREFSSTPGEELELRPVRGNVKTKTGWWRRFSHARSQPGMGVDDAIRYAGERSQ